MILNSQPRQLRLQDDGQILWQADPTNPLPGVPVAAIVKGDSQLAPRVVLKETDLIPAQEAEAVQAFIQAWLIQHIGTVLEILLGLVKEDGLADPAKEIAAKVHDALGIVPRQDIEAQIAALDPDARKALRQRHVRLGPILVFVPELNKPAAVRLRALLWWLWQDRVLPAPVPKDGAVSVLVDDASADQVYYRAIGYPLYGGRAIRVDMLDRVVSAVYDNAKDGNFKATHAMAEWLGCSIPGLYAVLESMGHKKIHDPADNPPPPPPVLAVVEEIPAAVSSSEAEPVTPPAVPETPVAKAPAVKPELALFRLKRGKANQAERPPAVPRPDRIQPERIQPDRIKPDKTRDEKKSYKDKKPRHRDDKDKFREDKKPVSFEARPKTVEDSPFAILQQLKAGMKDT